MKQTIIKISTFAGLMFLIASSAFAATFTLTNGGLGQAAANTQQFGVAVCNKSTANLTQPVPVVVTTNGESATISSASTIQAGSCEYSYLPYSQLGMKSGVAYAVSVTIDPQDSVISNSDNATVYNVTVPGQVAVAVNNTPAQSNLTADIASQFANPLVSLWNWLGDLYRSF
jgi:hypothetical protein